MPHGKNSTWTLKRTSCSADRECSTAEIRVQTFTAVIRSVETVQFIFIQFQKHQTRHTYIFYLQSVALALMCEWNVMKVYLWVSWRSIFLPAESESSYFLTCSFFKVTWFDVAGWARRPGTSWTCLGWGACTAWFWVRITVRFHFLVKLSSVSFHGLTPAFPLSCWPVPDHAGPDDRRCHGDAPWPQQGLQGDIYTQLHKNAALIVCFLSKVKHELWKNNSVCSWPH